MNPASGSPSHKSHKSGPVVMETHFSLLPRDGRLVLQSASFDPGFQGDGQIKTDSRGVWDLYPRPPPARLPRPPAGDFGNRSMSCPHSRSWIREPDPQRPKFCVPTPGPIFCAACACASDPGYEPYESEHDSTKWSDSETRRHEVTAPKTVLKVRKV